MQRSQRLDPVVTLAKQKEQEALTELGKVSSAWQKDKQQLDDLNQYKADYLQRFRQGDIQQLGANKVMAYRAFLAQLDQAIKVQQQQVGVSLNAVEYQRSVWMQKRAKTKALMLLVEKYQGAELAMQLRREQLENDEYNTNKWLRSRRET
jgi:flagellar FliJ protein